MVKINSIFNSNGRRYPNVVLALVFLLLAGAGAFIRPHLANTGHKPDDKDKPGNNAVAFPYHTITTAVDSQDLYAYELHKRVAMQDELPEYCAVIRQVDPAKDDYKTYCKLVISDIIKTTGTDKLVVYIYDSNEAYELYETKFLQHYTNLDTVEMNTVNEHSIATYTGKREFCWDYSENYLLSYYGSAHNGRTGQEAYQPQ